MSGKIKNGQFDLYFTCSSEDDPDIKFSKNCVKFIKYIRTVKHKAN